MKVSRIRYSEEIVTCISPVVAFETGIKMKVIAFLRADQWTKRTANQRTNDTKNTWLPICL